MLGGPFKEGKSNRYHPNVLTDDSKPMKSLRLIHITKCAGTTLESVSKKSWGKHDHDYSAAVSSVYTRDGSSWHVPLQYAKPHVLRDLLKKFDYFMVVRNPYDRVVSEFFCPWGGAGNRRNNTTVSGFNEWISKRLCTVKAQMSDKSPDSALQGHWTPQYMYCEDADGRLIVRRENVVLLEDLQNQYARLIERYGLSEEYQLSNTESLNVGTSKSFSPADLDSRNVALIGEVYEKDFEFFGFSKEISVLSPRTPNTTQQKPKQDSVQQSSAAPSAKVLPSSTSGGVGDKSNHAKKRKIEVVQTRPNASFQQLLSLMKKQK